MRSSHAYRPDASPAPRRLLAVLAFLAAFAGLLGQPGPVTRSLQPAAPFADTTQDIGTIAVKPRQSARPSALPARAADAADASSAYAAIPVVHTDIAPTFSASRPVGPTTHQVATPAIIAAQPRAPPQDL